MLKRFFLLLVLCTGLCWQASVFAQSHNHDHAPASTFWQPDHGGSSGRWVLQRNQIPQGLPHKTSPVLTRPGALVRAGMLWDGAPTIRWEIRFWQPEQGWSNWKPMKLVHREGQVHVSHLDAPSQTTHMQLRYYGAGHPTYLALSWLTKLGEPGAKPLPTQTKSPSYGTSVQALTAPYLPRSKWGAKPARCSTANSTKKYMAVHHTAGPNNDSSSPEVRLRQIQSFHQNTRKWCDIAYHILISLDGRAWEGRPWNVLGSHVGGANSNNLGICFFGTYTSVTPSKKMLCAGSQVIDWGVKKFGIARSRSVIRGHREHPGQSTTCPGNGILNQMNKMVAGTSAFCGGSTTPTLDAKFAGQGAKGAYGAQNGQYYSLCPGQSFQFYFTVTNTGTLTWVDNGKTSPGQSVRLGFKGGERFGAPTRISLNNASLKTVKPGQKVTFTINGKAPTRAGKYKTEWQMISEGSKIFGPVMYLTFNVSTLPAGSGKSCNSGQKGICATGKTQCSAGKLACVATVKPQTEVCDSKDNDCDGQTDEGCQCKAGDRQPCYNGPAGTDGKGPCKKGTQTCASGRWGTCVGAVLPSTEKCNGKDDDCDGQIDNGNPGAGQFCNPSSSGSSCKQGITVCSGGRLSCKEAPSCNQKEPVKEPPPIEEKTPDAGTGNDKIVIQPDSKPDTKPTPDNASQEVIVLGGGGKCQTKKDCRNGQDCIQNTCQAIPAGQGGCGCTTTSHDSTFFWWFGLLLLLGLKRRKK